MKICRFDDNTGTAHPRLGVVLDDGVHDVTSVLSRIPPVGYPLPRHDLLVAALPALRAELEAAARKSPALQPKRLLAPVANPGKIIAAPVNYTKHLQEALADKGIHHGNLISEIHKAGMFLKATSAVVGPGEGVKLIHTDRRNDHEVELAIVIGSAAKNVSPADAPKHIAGYCIGLDMTIRGPEERSFRKSPDSYCVLGPWLVTADEIPDPNNLSISISVNGEKRQDAHTSDLIVKVAELVAWGSTFYTLHPGDVLLTGTPQGVGPVKAGDVMEARLEKVGSMTVAVS